MKAAVWSIIATIFLGILVLIVNKLWDPIAEHVGYPFDVRRRVQNLLDAVKRLREIHGDLVVLLDTERFCSGWVQSVQRLCLAADEIKAGHDRCGPLNYFGKCHYAKQADIELSTANDLVVTGERNLKDAQARPRPGRRVLLQHPQNQLLGMDSYKQKVRAFIQDSITYKSGLLGIWGMGGVGKTSLVEFVRDSMHDHLFDHVLLVQAGRGATVGKTQKAIAAAMGLPVMPDETSQEGVIYNHLNDKNFLLLIDDLWGYHDLKHVGIPMPLGTVLCLPDGGTARQYRRKVVFTTRSYDVCGQMECATNAIRLECLSKDDAWKLFEDKVGKQIIDDPQLQKLARKLVDKCSGLPMALCTIGRAMSTTRDPKEWISVLDHLEKSKFRETNINDGLFESLKLSYDDMGHNLKDCFLVCALWPGDENIPKEKLIGWWTGLGFLDGSNAIYGGYSIINALVRKSMLEEGDPSLYSSKKSHVKMHKVTRKMALWVVNDHGEKERCLPLSSYRSALPVDKWSTVQKAWISAIDSSEWSSSVDCPELTMLVSRNAFSFEVSPCFQNMRFLDLEGTAMYIFPLVICQLEKLQYLNLSATTIGALPLELKKLSNLKYLYIRHNGALQSIPEELISQLAKLMVLDLFCSGTVSNEGQYFSSLIKGFPSKKICLILGITVYTEQDVMKLIGLKMVVHTQALCMHHFEADRHLHIIELELLSDMKKLRELTITNSPDIQELVAKKQRYDENGLLPYLEFFELSNLLKLEKVTWKNAGISIRVIVIYNCTKLRHVTWVQCLKTLEELTIAYCPELEKVIDNAELQQDMVVANQANGFGRLTKLYLEELPKLSIISEHSRPFEELSYVFVARCENLKIIRVEQRRNDNKIKIDCNEGWWTSLGENQGKMNRHFLPTFCF